MKNNYIHLISSCKGNLNRKINKDCPLLLFLPCTVDGDDYYLNMENNYLLTELKSTKEQSRIELTKARYTYSMALIGMSVISYYKNNPIESDTPDIPTAVRRISSMISPVLIPMLESMADLEVDAASMTA